MMSIPPGAGVGWLFSPMSEWLLFDHDVDVLIYEFIAFLLPRRRQLVRAHAPFVNTIRRHHTAITTVDHDGAQHEPDIPDHGLAVPAPRTSMRLIGHLLNGYESRYVKTNMRQTSRTPKPNMAGPSTGFATPAE